MLNEKTHLTIIIPHINRKSDFIAKSTIKALKKHHVYIITYQKGKEFAQHNLVANEFNAEIYFANFYAYHQRQINENIN